jgi:hypothetical protein
MNTHKNHGRLWISGALAALAALLAAASATPGVVKAPTAVSLTISPGGATCSYNETATPKLKCLNLRGARIKSGTKITLVAKANSPMPASWKLYIQKEGPLPDNRAAHAAASHHKDSYPAPHLCGPTKAASCTAKTTRNVSVTSFDLFRAVVQKDDGTSFEADLTIRWCDKSTPGCV